jgi:hypothetical protein
MPLNAPIEFLYHREPVIDVSVSAGSSGRSFRTTALLDTGANLSLFDDRIASRIGLDLADAPTIVVRGLSGDIQEVRLASVELRLLIQDDLHVFSQVGFASHLDEIAGNLIGLDVLASFDFGLSHANRVGYLGRAEV